MKQMWETYFKSCEVTLLQEKCGTFQPSGCVNRSLAIYITKAVTDHNKHERKPKVRWHCKTKIKIPAIADRQTGGQTLPDTACCTCVRYRMGLPPFLSIHYNSEMPQISPIAIWGEASPKNNGICFNKLHVKLCKLFLKKIIFLFISVTGTLFCPNSVFKIYFFVNYKFFGTWFAFSHVNVKHLRHWVPGFWSRLIALPIQPFSSIETHLSRDIWKQVLRYSPFFSGERLCWEMKRKDRFVETAKLWSTFFLLPFCVRYKAFLSKLVLPTHVWYMHENKIIFRMG